MKELPFSIPVMGVIRLDGNSVKVIVNYAETSIMLPSEFIPMLRSSLEPGQTMYDVILETAQNLVKEKGFNRFSAPELYGKASEKYPHLKRNSFISRVVASTPDHQSFRHYSSTRDYFSHIGKGQYQLNRKYLPEKNVNVSSTTTKQKGTLFSDNMEDEDD